MHLPPPLARPGLRGRCELDKIMRPPPHQADTWSGSLVLRSQPIAAAHNCWRVRAAAHVRHTICLSVSLALMRAGSSFPKHSGTLCPWRRSTGAHGLSDSGWSGIASILRVPGTSCGMHPIPKRCSMDRRLPEAITCR